MTKQKMQEEINQLKSEVEFFASEIESKNNRILEIQNEHVEQINELHASFDKNHDYRLVTSLIEEVA